MRRIVKTCHLSTVYKNWHDALEAGNSDHPEYSAAHQYYVDVVMNLLHCQNGLCAYTEMVLCPTDSFEANKWNAGRYGAAKPEWMGQLEHFDSTLKPKKGWLWGNLFVVASDINTKVKGQRAVDSSLKPDAADYDPREKLEYNVSMHVFVARSDLSDALRARVTTMIQTLGLNHGTVRQLRINQLTQLLKSIELGVETWDTVVVYQFPTAFAMMRSQRQHA